MKNRTPESHSLRIAASLFLFTLAAGCTVTEKGNKRYELGVAATAARLANSAAFRDTVGAYTFYEGLAPMRVRGYGLVVGLGKNGSSDCPKPIYDRIVQNMYKQNRYGSSGVVGVKDLTPEAMINDVDTAVVVVYGDIPPAAVEGSRFDVTVTALPGTQTKSLRGGRLFTADLEMYRVVSPDVSISGRILARAAGPVFINPFSDEQSATKANPLEGTILGGGTVLMDRRIRLVLTEPSYQRARRIQDRINSQFPGGEKVADAQSPSFIQLRVPPEFRDDTGHFLTLLRCLYLSRDPSFEAARARALADEIVRPDAPHAQIASCFEGLGRKALPALTELYSQARDFVSFHAAAAGLRLDDHIAGDVIVAHASNPKSPFRFQAIRALGEATDIGGTAVSLRRLLADEDPRVQVAAYEALIRRHDPTIDSHIIGGDNFILDVIPASPSRFVYVKRTEERRIALFGDDLRCTPPVLYRSPDGSLTLNARAGDEEFTAIRTVIARNLSSPSLPAPFELPKLVTLLGNEAGIAPSQKVLGLGLDYGAVVHAIYHLCQIRAVDAQFVLEQPNAAELFGPGRPQGRPESEL